MKTKTPLEELQQYTGKEFITSPSPFMHWLKPMVVSASEGKIIFEYSVRKEMTNPIGTLHGGVTAAIIDDVIGVAMYSFNEDFFYTTINNSIDYFATAKEGDIITAETTVLKKGRQIVNVQCEIWSSGRKRLIARGYSNLLKTNIRKH